MLRIAVIGVGNMGSKYAVILQEGRIEGAVLAALTRVSPGYRDVLKATLEKEPYVKVIRGFVAEIRGEGRSVADGRDGRRSLLLSNAIYLSSWEKRMVEIPEIGSDEEKKFENRFEETMKKRCRM